MPNGYTPTERRANVKKQLRDRVGKWIEMGGKIKFLAGGIERVGDVLDIEGDYVITEVEAKPGGRKVRAKVHRNNVEAVNTKASIRNPETGPKVEVDNPQRRDYRDGAAIQSRDEVSPEALDQMPDGTVIALDRVFDGPYQITYTKDGDGWVRSVEGGAPEAQKLPSTYVSTRVSQSLGNNERGLGVIDRQTIFKPQESKASTPDDAQVTPEDATVELTNPNQTNRNELARLDDGTQLILHDEDGNEPDSVFEKSGNSWNDTLGNNLSHEQVEIIFKNAFAEKENGTTNYRVMRRDVSSSDAPGVSDERRAELDQQISDLYEEEQDLIDFGEPQAKIRAVRKKREALEAERDGVKKDAAPAREEDPARAPIDARSSDLPGEPIEVEDLDSVEEGERVQLFGGGIADEPVDKFEKREGAWLARDENGDEFEFTDEELRNFIERVDPTDIQRLPALGSDSPTPRPRTPTPEPERTPTPEPAARVATPRAKTTTDDFFDMGGEGNELVAEAAEAGRPFEIERPDGYVARVRVETGGRVRAGLFDPNGEPIPFDTGVEDEEYDLEDTLDAMNDAVELDKNPPPVGAPTEVGEEPNGPVDAPDADLDRVLAPGEIGDDNGRKYLQDASGKRVYEGSRVKSNKDGLEGEIVKIEGNGLYVKVRGDDGKVRGRRVSTLSALDTADATPAAAPAESPARVDTPAVVELEDLPNMDPPAIDAPAVPRGQVGTDNLGRKYVSANDGQPIFKGTKVKSRKDGLEGQVVTIEGNGHYVKILGTDGKVRGRKIDTLDVTSAEELEQKLAPAPTASEPIVLEPPSVDAPNKQADPLGINDLYNGGNGKYRVIGKASAGVMGITDFLEFPDGQRVVRKRITGRHGGNANSEADSEILSGQLAHAMGINQFYAVDGGIDTKGRRVVLMPMIYGKMADDVGYRLGGGYARDLNRDGRMDLMNAKEIGILDFVISNSDRHEQNWMVGLGERGGQPRPAIPIDHGGARWTIRGMWGDEYTLYSPFSKYFLGKSDGEGARDQLADKLTRIKLEDIQKTRDALQRLKEMFVNLDRVEWFEQAIEKLDELERRL